ncbi:MAG: sulfotransferase [Parachlamydiaceae bacterium]|nr:sulfotransferase [Parachlamydiaceae bacterium]
MMDKTDLSKDRADNGVGDCPVFVVGSSRSGTTLMYSILLSSGEFAVYEAETLLLDVCSRKYGNLSREKNYDRFIGDWLQSKQFYRSMLDAKLFKKEARFHCSSYTDLLKFFMGKIAVNQGKKRWAEQTPGHLFYMDILAEEFPNAKFIHVIRDGRDVALSRRKLGWTGSRSKNPLINLLSAALCWELCVEYGRVFAKKNGNNYLEIKYEELVLDLDGTLMKLNKSLDIIIDREKMKKCKLGSLKKGNTVFDDNMQGISDKGVGRWRSEFNEVEKAALNIAIGRTLKRLGYEIKGASDTTLFSLKIKLYTEFYRFFLALKRFSLQYTFLGRFSSDSLEIGSK